MGKISKAIRHFEFHIREDLFADMPSTKSDFHSFPGVSGEKITKASIYKKSFQLTRNNLEDREGRLNIAAFVVDIGIWICSTTVAISL